MKPKYQKIGILGYGEVGRAISKFYAHPKIKNRSRNDDLVNVDILHVCIPYSSDFVSIVKQQIQQSKPKITIIHSTVAVGTTRAIGGMVVHSPIRGVHPHLYKGIQTFVKFIGADSNVAARRAERHLKSLGLRTKVFFPSQTTELGKLLDTTYYGLCIAFHGEIAKVCRTYNLKLGMEHVIRPVLTAPNPAIGVHCILPNTKILKKQFKSSALDLILAYRPKETK